MIKINLPGPKGTAASNNASLNLTKLSEQRLPERSFKDPLGDSAVRAFEMAQSFERQRVAAGSKK